MVSPVTAEEALGRLDPTERGWVEGFCTRVRDAYGERIRDLRLFGSKVRGDDHEESDVDLLVLVDRLDRETTEGIHEIARSVSSRLEPWVFDFDRYHAPKSRASGVYKEIRKESVRL